MGTAVKVILIIVVIGLIGLGGIAFCFYQIHQAGSALQDEFFGAATSGDVDKLMATLHPDLREKVDRPVMEAWMAALKENLGEYKGMSMMNSHTSFHQGTGGKQVESKGTIEFEKGEAHSELTAIDDQVVSFSVKSDAMPEDWLRGIKDKTLYLKRAETFLRALVSADADAALGMMHEELRKQFSDKAAFQKSVERLKVRFGPEVPMHPKAANWQEGDHAGLVVRFSVRSGAEQAVGMVRFGFDKMRGTVYGFALPEG